MRKISMFLICSTLLAVPAFAADTSQSCPEGEGYVSAKRQCYPIARTTDNAEVIARDQVCWGDQKPANSDRTGWQYYFNGQYCVNACKSGDEYVCCVCGVYSCEENYEPNAWNTECVPKQGSETPAESDVVQTVSTEGTDDCSDGSVMINSVQYDCAKNESGEYVTRDGAEACHRTQKPNYADRTAWIFNRAGSHACKSGNRYVRCQCGIHNCRGGYRPNSWKTECVDANGNPAPAEPDSQNVDTTDTEAPQECEGGNQTIGGQTYPCATDAENNIIVVGRPEEPCRENFGVTTANTQTCKWQNAAATDTENVFACKDASNAFVTCVYRITACVDDNFESRDGGLTCQEKAGGQTVVHPGTQPVDTKSIATLAGRLAKVENQFGLSKWRTADGEFNKARLASDLTAGVVLGTTGALVTASVVKKKQVKDGFESLECTIGGQHVGDYGDTFHIFGK